MCKHCKKLAHIKANCWNKHGKSNWAKEKDQKRKQKKPNDNSLGVYYLSPLDSKLIIF